MSFKTIAQGSFRFRLSLALVSALGSLLVLYVVFYFLMKDLLHTVDLAQALLKKNEYLQRIEDTTFEIKKQLEQIQSSAATSKKENQLVINTLIDRQTQDLKELLRLEPVEFSSLQGPIEELHQILRQKDTDRFSATDISQLVSTFAVQHADIQEAMNQLRILLNNQLRDTYKKISRQKQRPLYIGTFLLVLLGIGLSVLFVSLHRRVRRFWAQMNERMQFVKSGAWGVRLPVVDRDVLSKVELEFEQLMLRLDQLRLQLTESNRDLEEFAQMASHDLQSPLRYIQSFSKLLTENPEQYSATERAEFAANIERSTSRLRLLIQDLLSYSKIGHSGLTFEDRNLSAILHQVIEEAVAKYDDLSIRLIHEDTVLKCNTPLLQTLFQNLIENSVKYRSQDHVEIFVECLKGGSDFEIIYSDNGPGVPAKDRNKIFDLFQRRDSDLEKPGQGIGLAVCKKIMKIHNGTIEVLEGDRGLKLGLRVRSS